MRVSMGGLTVWSFLMATAHGAGLMVVPVFMGMSMSGAGEHAHHMSAAATGAGAAFIATGVHAVGYLAVTAFMARRVGDRDAIVERRRRITFRELDRAAGSAAGDLARAGVRPGMRALVFSPMSIALYTTMIALFRLRAAAVFVDPSAGRERLYLLGGLLASAPTPSSPCPGPTGFA